MKAGVRILCLLTLLAISGCGSTSTRILLNNHEEFNFILKYGVEARNVINTFHGTFTKDMVVDSSITTNLSLSPNELDTIRKELNRIDIFEYPDHFRPHYDDINLDEVVFVSPHSTYSLTIKIGEHIKEVYWNDTNDSVTLRAKSLRDLFERIRMMIEAKEEFKKLPVPRGVYI